MSKKNYFTAQFNTRKNNLKATWKLIGNLIKRKSKCQQFPNRLRRNSLTYIDNKCIVNQFNEHFINVGPKLANSIGTCLDDPCMYIDNSPVSSFVMYPVSESEVQSLFNSLDGNRSSTSVPNILVKTASNILSPVFTVILNQSISTGIVPCILKIASITPIFKSGAVTDPNNYRPISILSPFAKILKRLVYDQLRSFLTNHNIIYDYQFGFRKGHSTEQAILETTDYFKKSIYKNEVTCGLFLDFKFLEPLSIVIKYKTSETPKIDNIFIYQNKK